MAQNQTGADLQEQFKPLSEAGIQASTDDKSYERGYDYYLNQNISEPMLSEAVLRAFCHGSQRNPYRVEATLLPASDKESDRKLATVNCSCPRGGFCKHIVALLLTWLHKPESFIVRSGLMARLSMKSHEELLTLLEELMHRQHDIESLVELLMELPLASTTQEEKGSGQGRECTLDLFAIRQQVSMAFDNAGDGWEAAYDIAHELERVYDIGKSFAQAGQWANALVIYSTVAEEAILQYESFQDEGQVSWVIGECATGLAECLSVQPSLPPDDQLDEGGREELFTALFGLWRFGHEYGGIDVNIPDLIAEHATKDERERVELWLREEIEESSHKWRESSIVNFLVTLKQAGHYSDEDLLEEYRDAGLYKELAQKLLELSRASEALSVAQANLTEQLEVTKFAEQLLTSGETWAEPALAFVETRLAQAERTAQSNPKDFTIGHAVSNYRHWLSEKYILYGKTQQALDMELARFQANPDEHTYYTVQSTAQEASQSKIAWSDLRPRLIKTLEQKGRWGALISIYLKEGEVGQALSALAEMEQSTPGSLYGYGYRPGVFSNNYQVQVARAAEEQYPNDAIRLYKPVVETLISGRGRENYQQAANYLTRIKALYQKLKRESEWHTYITNLRNSNKSLRALKEELDKKNL